LLLLVLAGGLFAAPILFVNQVGFDSKGPKTAVLQTDAMLEEGAGFNLIEEAGGRKAFSGKMGPAQQMTDWAPGKWFYTIDFSGYEGEGRFHLEAGGCRSDVFLVGENEPVRSMISSIIQYYHHQRANTPGELEADRVLRLYGSDKRVDMRGGWCDASGDVSKYFSHLAYANFMSPQQIPLVVWSMGSVVQAIPGLLDRWGLRDSLEQEALWGADYMMRALSEEGYFRMIVFSYFKKDPDARRVVGLHANSVTTDEYQCAFREGGGMAIAALARVSRWKKHGEFSGAQYLDAAKRAYAHLVVNNTKYDDDGKENIIDDYCALMAATELWIATDSGYYRDQARGRAQNLAGRMTKGGYFIADDGFRPFWHASDAGLPVVALSRYLSREDNPLLRRLALLTIKKSLDYQIAVTGEVYNPFGYPRQTFMYKEKLQNGFFIPHENETGWWWQGENARLGSLATAALVGGRLVAPGAGKWGVDTALGRFASRQISWILGCNPYSICFMYGFGKKNVPYMASNYGHGSEKGGISNGVTGRDGNEDGSGIDFKEEAAGNEWRWTEQWIPHAAWFLQVLAAISEDTGR
jgi:hypothetical protein